MDIIDKKIVLILREDSRTPFLHIAKKIGVSEGTIRNRVKELTKKGTIKRFTIDTKGTYFGFVGLKTNPKEKTIDVLKRVKKIGIERAFEISGDFDAIVFLGFMKREEANTVLEKIRATKGIIETKTFTILNEAF